MLLEQIVSNKKREVAGMEASRPLGIITSALGKIKKPRNFKQNLKDSGGLEIIAEVKRASPVKGLLCSDFDPVRLARAYQRGGAGAISVITESKFFKGDPAYINQVKESSELPVLRKDFIINEYQVFESRVLGADAILLIVSILDQYMLRRLVRLAAELGMTALVEVHNRDELKKAIVAGADLIGINNRNLKTFNVNLFTTLQLVADIPEDTLVVSESGITSREDILLLEQAGVDAVLVGETLVRSTDPSARLNELRGLPVEGGSRVQCG